MSICPCGGKVDTHALGACAFVRESSNLSGGTIHQIKKSMVIKCPKCKQETEFTISDAQDEDGEVFRCKHCGWLFRYANH